MNKPKRFHFPLFVIFLTGISFAIDSCEPLATGWDELTDAEYRVGPYAEAVPDTFTSVKIMTWNIRFGAGRRSWFGDACGDITVFSPSEILETTQLIVDKVNEIDPDILLLQEVDLGSKRSSYIDQLEYIMQRTSFRYVCFGAQWKTQFIPSDGLGRLYEVNAILSKWKITGAKRVTLPLRGDQGSLTRYFYERACMIGGRVWVPHTNGIFIINIHASAFATDDTKYKHILRLRMEMDNLDSLQLLFVAGGDFNTLPPGSDSLDYCYEDMCQGESFHKPGDEPFHKDGSNYAHEQTWLDPIYYTYHPAIPLSDYMADQEKYFSHTTRPDHFWDRTLDYLFTNGTWKLNSGTVHQEALQESDHAPVVAILKLNL